MTLKIVFTGGGTAGHVTPNVALIHVLKPAGWNIEYIGSPDGVEKAMMTSLHVPYHAVSSGKLRRYFSLKNFFDPLNIVRGIWQSFWLLQKIKPNVVFSKGGFVAFPVVVGAWLNSIPIIAHESDMSPGLANRLSFPFVDQICVTFAEAKQHFKQKDKVEITGTPIRQELFEGNKTQGLSLCGFNDEKPCVLIIGGSQGARVLNDCVRLALDELCERFQVIHLCGKGKVDNALLTRPGYCQFEYADKDLPDLFAASDMVISRAGANTLYEILALGKPHVLIPLSEQASRGDQVQNARYFEQQGISVVVKEEALTPKTLLAAVNEVLAHQDAIIEKINALGIVSATTKITGLIRRICGLS